jgi:hypothetical protein
VERLSETTWEMWVDRLVFGGPRTSFADFVAPAEMFLGMHTAEPRTAAYYLNDMLGMPRPVIFLSDGKEPRSIVDGSVSFVNTTEADLTVTWITRWERERCTHRSRASSPYTLQPEQVLQITFGVSDGDTWEMVPIPATITPFVDPLLLGIDDGE